MGIELHGYWINTGNRYTWALDTDGNGRITIGIEYTQALDKHGKGIYTGTG